MTIENADGALRPGMTVFARIDFDRRMIGRILLGKIKQSLRPELWMFLGPERERHSALPEFVAVQRIIKEA